MKKLRTEPDCLEIFSESKIGILICAGVDNHIKDENQYESYLRGCEKQVLKHIENPKFTQNSIVRT